MTPGRKFSITTSAVSIRRAPWHGRRPDFRSSEMRRLPRWKNASAADFQAGPRGRIDVDDVGALVGQHHGGQWPGDVLAEIDNA